MIFQRDSIISKIKISPFGKISVESFSMAQRGGFDKGTLLSIKSVSAHVDIQRLFRREFLIKDIHARRINIDLDYSSGNFNYYFFSNVKYIFMNKFSGYGMIKSVKAHSILLDDAEVALKLKSGMVKFKNIVLFSEVFNHGNTFEGTGTFDFEFNVLSSSASFRFSYNKEEQIIYISDFISPSLSFSAEGKIKFKDGKADLEYTVKINKEKFPTILSLIPGIQYSAVANAPSDGAEEIIISYH
jgi:hypothetical protein